MINLNSGWYFYRLRVPHPETDTVDEMNRILFPELYVEVTNEEEEDEDVENHNDSVSLDTQPDNT